MKDERLSIVRERKLWKKLVEFLVALLAMQIIYTIAFYLIWPFLPPPKFAFLLVDVGVALIYIKLFKLYLRRDFHDDKVAISCYLKNIFLYYFIVYLFMYIYSTPDFPSRGDFTKSYFSNMVVVNFVLFIVYLVLYKKYRKKEVK